MRFLEYLTEWRLADSKRADKHIDDMRWQPELMKDTFIWLYISGAPLLYMYPTSGDVYIGKNKVGNIERERRHHDFVLFDFYKQWGMKMDYDLDEYSILDEFIEAYNLIRGYVYKDIIYPYDIDEASSIMMKASMVIKKLFPDNWWQR